MNSLLEDFYGHVQDSDVCGLRLDPRHNSLLHSLGTHSGVKKMAAGNAEGTVNMTYPEIVVAADPVAAAAEMAV